MNIDSSFIHCEVPFKYRFFEALCFFSLHLYPKSTFLSDLRRKNSLAAANYLKNSNHSPQLIQIDRVRNISYGDFVKKYFSKNLPVIIEQGAADWPCTQKWSLNYLAQIYPQAKLEVLQSVGFVEKEYYNSNGDDKPYVEKTITAKDLTESIGRGEKIYIRFSQLLDIQKELIRDLNLKWLKKFGQTFWGSGYQSFLGCKDRKTPLHSGLNSFFYIMADGEKRWTLYSASSAAIIRPSINKRVYNYSDVDINSPDKDSYPGFNLLSHFKFNLTKGDILYVPAWMYHEVENLKDGWGTNYRFNALAPIFRYPMFLLVRMFFSSPNIFTPIYERSFLSGRKDRGSQSLR